MAKIIIGEKIVATKKLNELRSQVLAAADDVKAGKKDLVALQEEMEEFKKIERGIADAKSSMFTLLYQALQHGTANYVEFYEGTLKIEIEEVLAPFKKKEEKTKDEKK